MNIITYQLTDIKPYDNNPRNNEEAVQYVANSIQEFGFKVPIVIDKDGVIVAGHTRYKAAQQLGLDKVPCIVADDLTPEQIKAFRLADNKTAEIATWDFEKLSLELNELEMYEMSVFGFDEESEENEIESGDVIEDDFDGELPEESYVKKGHIYKLGNHRLMCGDSTEIEDVKKLTDGEKVDLLLTDPPYNVDYVGKTKEALKIQNDKMSDDNFKLFLSEAFKNADEVMKPGAAFYIWHADSEGHHFRNACFEIEWKVRQCLIWNKNTFVLGRQDYHWKHEPCLYGWKDGAAHNFYSDRKQTTVLDFEKPLRNEEHPTMKPIPLFAYIVENSSKKGDIVLDLFAGSGTTLIACEQLGRAAHVMEFDPKYAQVIIERWEEFTGEKAVLINGNTKPFEAA